MNRELIIIVAAVISALILYVLVKTERWAKNSGQPSLISLIKGCEYDNSNTEEKNSYSIKKTVRLAGVASVLFSASALTLINSGKDPCKVKEISDKNNWDFSIEIDSNEVDL